MKDLKRLGALSAGALSCALCLYLAFVLLVGLDPTLYNPPVVSIEKPLSDSGLVLSLDLTPPDASAGTGTKLQLRNLTYLMREEITTVLPSQICLDSLDVFYWFDQPWYFSDVQRFLDEAPLCYDLGRARSGSSRLAGYNYVTVPYRENTTYPSVSLDWGAGPELALFYPYDTLVYTIAYEVKYHLGYPNGSTSSPDKAWTSAVIYISQTSDWEIVTSKGLSETLPMVLSEEDGGLVYPDSQQVAGIEFRRPLLIRVMFPVIVAVILAFIFLLCFVDSRGTFIEGAVGVFFGIFGLNQVLVPPNLQVRTLVHLASWGLYVALGAVVLVQLYFAIKETRSSQTSAESSLDPNKSQP